jgi:hypothetical protein
VPSPYYPYSSDLAPSDFHIFGPLNVTLRDRRFAKDDELKHSVREAIWRYNKEIYETGTQLLKQRREKCVANEEDFVEK